MRTAIGRVIAGILIAIARGGAAWGEEPAPEEPAPEEPAPEEPAPDAPTVDELAARIAALEAENRRLADEASRLREDLDYTSQRVDTLFPLGGKVTGYLDVGFFVAQGNGSGLRSDIAHLVFPEYSDIPDSWVFMGDPLSTAINSRGDPADTDGSLAIAYDPIDSDGHATFLVNALNVTLFWGIGESLTVNALIDFLPRGRDASDPEGLQLGDYVDVKLAYVEWLLPWERVPASVYVGKFDSVLGFEYRVQEAPDRLSVTPSLICRYICGHPIGLKLRARFFDDILVANVAVTNGSHFSEGFPFHDEIDSNDLKTVAGRLSVRFPVGAGLELGVSGAIGAQDATPSDDRLQWHVGADLHVDWRDLDFTAEWVKGKAPGEGIPGEPTRCGVAPCLDYQGAYGLLGWRATNWLTPYVRVDWRDALHENGVGQDFVYISELVRVTAGARFELGTHVIVKGEYTVNRELGRIPEFDNDVATTAMIIKY